MKEFIFYVILMIITILGAFNVDNDNDKNKLIFMGVFIFILFCVKIYAIDNKRYYFY